MRAVRIHEYGPAEVLRVEEVPDPVPGPRDVLVEVHAASVNPVDWKLRAGAQRAVVRWRLPWILGLDVSGVVRAVGSEVRRFQVGDEVISTPSYKRPGTYAELVAIDEREVARKPARLDHRQAAALPLAGLTAWQCLVGKGRVTAGQRVFITAGSGGVGHLAIQIAKHFGAHVATTCSGRNARFVGDLGADQVIDYTQQDFVDLLRDVDLVLDAHGGEDSAKALRVLRGGGALTFIAPDVAGRAARLGPYLGIAATGLSMGALLVRGRLLYGVRVHHVIMRPDGEELGQLAALCEQGAVTPVVDRVFSLDEIADAHRFSETGRTRGKLVIAIR